MNAYSALPIRGMPVAAMYFPLYPLASMALLTLSARSYDLMKTRANISANIWLCLVMPFISPPPRDFKAFIMAFTIFKVMKINLYDMRNIWSMGEGNTRYIIVER